MNPCNYSTISHLKPATPRLTAKRLFSGILLSGFALALLGVSAACSPTVQLAAPTEPIHIKLDVKIEHEIRIKVERELDELLSPESGLF